MHVPNVRHVLAEFKHELRPRLVDAMMTRTAPSVHRTTTARKSEALSLPEMENLCSHTFTSSQGKEKRLWDRAARKKTGSQREVPTESTRKTSCLKNVEQVCERNFQWEGKTTVPIDVDPFVRDSPGAI